MSELVLFGEELPAALQSTRAEASARANRIRVGLVAIATFADDVKAAWAARDWAALGYESWQAYAEGEFGEGRLPAVSREQRRELVADLRGASMSTRAIAAVLSVHHDTVASDLKPGVGNPTPEHMERITGADGKSYSASRLAPTAQPRPAPAPWPNSVPNRPSAPWQPPPSFPPSPEPSMSGDSEIVDAEIVEDVPPTPPADPEAFWSEEEKQLVKRLRAGETVVVSLRGQHANLIAWVEPRGLYVRIDRRSEWGNPFELPADGDRETVIRNYAEHYLPHKPSLLNKIETLAGKALGCWCAPEACHGDVLKEATEQ